MKKCMFVLCEQIADRLKIQFKHRAVSFDAVKRLNREAPAVFEAIDKNHHAAKELCHAVFNGKQLPESLHGN
eukprot:2018772-Karenia_brevis.AAC.1